MGEQHGYHWWNRLDSGVEVDVTREQFRDGQVVTPKEVVARPVGPVRRQREYETFRRRVLVRLGLPPDTGPPPGVAGVS